LAGICLGIEINKQDLAKSHQDRESGNWPGDSMNKKYPSGSIEKGFMQDAATAFATLALLEVH